MQFEELVAIKEVIDHQIKLAKDYIKDMEIMSTNKTKFMLMLTANLPNIRRNKKNVGLDMAMLMLMEEGYLELEQRKAAEDYYYAYQQALDRCKGLEKLMEAYQQKVIFAQSQMKYEKDNT